MPPDTCSCTWRIEQTALLRVPTLAERDPHCPNHGNASEWWRRVQEHARRLAEHSTRTAGQ